VAAASVTYPSGHQALSEVTLTVPWGRSVAIVGPSGCGKSTLLGLLVRFVEPTSGCVSFDGHDVRDVTLQSIADTIGVVSQDPHLFHDTVGANLRYVRSNATDAEVVAACKAARIHDVIAALPDGYETLVGERGYRMSGGEK